MLVATDVGGTFTDLVLYERDPKTGLSVARIGKTHSTPPHFERGVMNVLREADIDPARIENFVHGCTVVINTITERAGAITGLITTRGFADMLEIARGNRPDLFNVRYAKPKPFVPRYLRREISERVDYSGAVVTPVRLEELPAIIADFKKEGVGAIAISLLHSYANTCHELAVYDKVRELWPEVAVIASHQVIRAWREYERTNSAVLSAYVMPVTFQYLNKLEAALKSQGFKGNAYIMQSSGGSDSIAGVCSNPVSIMESGPASGMLGAAIIGRLTGNDNILALDIGGTTAKCALIKDGNLPIATDYLIEKTARTAGYPVMTPGVDIVEIGNGGGSLAWIDEGGKFRVGPKSAGAVPGPVAYGQGGVEPTTTDANLLLGRIDANYFLGGRVKADLQGVRAAMQKIGGKLGQTLEETARGIIRVANNNMINALKLISVNRGYDPRDFTLLAFGGGGPMHASSLARELSIPRIIIPIYSSVFSAWGMLMADMRRDYLLTHSHRLDENAAGVVNAQLDELEAQGRQEFVKNRKLRPETLSVRRYADLRYKGQEHTVKIEVAGGSLDGARIKALIEDFRKAFEHEYTFRLDAAVEIVTYHLVMFAKVESPEIPQLGNTGRTLDEARRGERSVDFDAAGIHPTAIYERDRLEPGMEIKGPAVIEQPDTTIVVFPGDLVSVDRFGNLIITRE